MTVLCMFYIKRWERCKDSLMVYISSLRGIGSNYFEQRGWVFRFRWVQLASSPSHFLPTAHMSGNREHTVLGHPCTPTSERRNDSRLTGIISQELLTPLITSSNQCSLWWKLFIAGRCLLDTESHNIHNGKKRETNAKVHQMASWLFTSIFYSLYFFNPAQSNFSLLGLML